MFYPVSVFLSSCASKASIVCDTGGAADRKLVVLGMGGTIAGRADDAADLIGYRAGELSVDQILAGVAVPAGHVVETEQVEHLHSPRIAWFYDQTGDTHFRKGKIRLNMARDGLSATGLLGGYPVGPSMSRNRAPVGSAASMIRPNGESSGPESTVPPSSAIRNSAASLSAMAK